MAQRDRPGGEVAFNGHGGMGVATDPALLEELARRQQYPFPDNNTADPRYAPTPGQQRARAYDPRSAEGMEPSFQQQAVGPRLPQQEHLSRLAAPAPPAAASSRGLGGTPPHPSDPDSFRAPPSSDFRRSNNFDSPQRQHAPLFPQAPSPGAMAAQRTQQQQHATYPGSPLIDQGRYPSGPDPHYQNGASLQPRPPQQEYYSPREQHPSQQREPPAGRGAGSGGRGRRGSGGSGGSGAAAGGYPSSSFGGGHGGQYNLGSGYGGGGGMGAQHRQQQQGEREQDFPYAQLQQQYMRQPPQAQQQQQQYGDVRRRDTAGGGSSSGPPLRPFAPQHPHHPQQQQGEEEGYSHGGQRPEQRWAGHPGHPDAATAYGRGAGPYAPSTRSPSLPRPGAQPPSSTVGRGAGAEGQSQDAQTFEGLFGGGAGAEGQQATKQPFEGLFGDLRLAAAAPSFTPNRPLGAPAPGSFPPSLPGASMWAPPPSASAPGSPLMMPQTAPAPQSGSPPPGAPAAPTTPALPPGLGAAPASGSSGSKAPLHRPPGLGGYSSKPGAPLPAAGTPPAPPAPSFGPSSAPVAYIPDPSGSAGGYYIVYSAGAPPPSTTAPHLGDPVTAAVAAAAAAAIAASGLKQGNSPPGLPPPSGSGASTAGPGTGGAAAALPPLRSPLPINGAASAPRGGSSAPTGFGSNEDTRRLGRDLRLSTNNVNSTGEGGGGSSSSIAHSVVSAALASPMGAALPTNGPASPSKRSHGRGDFNRTARMDAEFALRSGPSRPSLLAPSSASPTSLLSAAAVAFPLAGRAGLGGVRLAHLGADSDEPDDGLDAAAGAMFSIADYAPAPPTGVPGANGGGPGGRGTGRTGPFFPGPPAGVAEEPSPSSGGASGGASTSQYHQRPLQQAQRETPKSLSDLFSAAAVAEAAGGRWGAPSSQYIRGAGPLESQQQLPSALSQLHSPAAGSPLTTPTAGSSSQGGREDWRGQHQGQRFRDTDLLPFSSPSPQSSTAATAGGSGPPSGALVFTSEQLEAEGLERWGGGGGAPDARAQRAPTVLYSTDPERPYRAWEHGARGAGGGPLAPQQPQHHRPPFAPSAPPPAQPQQRGTIIFDTMRPRGYGAPLPSSSFSSGSGGSLFPGAGPSGGYNGPRSSAPSRGGDRWAGSDPSAGTSFYSNSGSGPYSGGGGGAPAAGGGSAEGGPGPASTPPKHIPAPYAPTTAHSTSSTAASGGEAPRRSGPPGRSAAAPSAPTTASRVTIGRGRKTYHFDDGGAGAQGAVRASPEGPARASPSPSSELDGSEPTRLGAAQEAPGTRVLPQAQHPPAVASSSVSEEAPLPHHPEHQGVWTSGAPAEGTSAPNSARYGSPAAPSSPPMLPRHPAAPAPNAPSFEMKVAVSMLAERVSAGPLPGERTFSTVPRGSTGPGGRQPPHQRNDRGADFGRHPAGAGGVEWGLSPEVLLSIHPGTLAAGGRCVLHGLEGRGEWPVTVSRCMRVIAAEATAPALVDAFVARDGFPVHQPGFPGHQASAPSSGSSFAEGGSGELVPGGIVGGGVGTMGLMSTPHGTAPHPLPGSPAAQRPWLLLPPQGPAHLHRPSASGAVATGAESEAATRRRGSFGAPGADSSSAAVAAGVSGALEAGSGGGAPGDEGSVGGFSPLLTHRSTASTMSASFARPFASSVPLGGGGSGSVSPRAHHEAGTWGQGQQQPAALLPPYQPPRTYLRIVEIRERRAQTLVDSGCALITPYHGFYREKAPWLPRELKAALQAEAAAVAAATPPPALPAPHAAGAPPTHGAVGGAEGPPTARGGEGSAGEPDAWGRRRTSRSSSVTSAAGVGGAPPAPGARATPVPGSARAGSPCATSSPAPNSVGPRVAGAPGAGAGVTSPSIAPLPLPPSPPPLLPSLPAAFAAGAIAAALASAPSFQSPVSAAASGPYTAPNGAETRPASDELELEGSEEGDGGDREQGAGTTSSSSLAPAQFSSPVSSDTGGSYCPAVPGVPLAPAPHEAGRDHTGGDALPAPGGSDAPAAQAQVPAAAPSAAADGDLCPEGGHCPTDTAAAEVGKTQKQQAPPQDGLTDAAPAGAHKTSAPAGAAASAALAEDASASGPSASSRGGSSTSPEGTTPDPATATPACASTEAEGAAAFPTPSREGEGAGGEPGPQSGAVALTHLEV